MTLMPPRDSKSRKKVIGSIRTPLGFFALMTLVIEGVSMGWALLIPCADRVALAISSSGILLTLTFIVGVLAYKKPGALAGGKIKNRKRRKNRVPKRKMPTQPIPLEHESNATSEKRDTA